MMWLLPPNQCAPTPRVDSRDTVPAGTAPVLEGPAPSAASEHTPTVCQQVSDLCALLKVPTELRPATTPEGTEEWAVEALAAALFHVEEGLHLGPSLQPCIAGPCEPAQATIAPARPMSPDTPPEPQENAELSPTYASSRAVNGEDIYDSRKATLELTTEEGVTELWYPGAPLPELWRARLNCIEDPDRYSACLYILGSRWQPSRSKRSALRASFARQIMDWLNSPSPKYRRPLSQKQLRTARSMEYKANASRMARIRASTEGAYDRAAG